MAAAWTGSGFRLDGRVALITGASHGLGRAIALGFARAGADVIVTSRKLEACEAVVSEIRSVASVHTEAIACHVGRWSDLDDLVAISYDRFGQVDVLVNNAGISPLYESLVAVTEEMYDKVLAVNLKGPFRLSALVGSRMRDGAGGSIINISSIAAIRPNPMNLPYTAAKAGLNAMTVGFAREYGPRVRVNCIMAGPFRTRISDSWSGDHLKAVQEAQALRRIGEPQEVVGAALYFASDASSFTTGAIMAVDGGMP